MVPRHDCDTAGGHDEPCSPGTDAPAAADLAPGLLSPVAVSGDRPYYRLEQSRRRSLLELAAVLAVVGAGLGLEALLRNRGTEVEVPAMAITVLLPIAAFCTVGGSWRSLGLARPRWARDLGIGVLMVPPAHLVTGVVAITAIGVSLLARGSSLESLYAAKRPMMSAVAEVAPASVLPFALFVGFYEEIVFRGFLLSRMVSVLGDVRVAIGVNALVFGALHYASQGWLGLVQTTCLGAILGGLAVWRRGVWSAIGCHAGIDTMGIALVIWLKPLLDSLVAGKL